MDYKIYVYVFFSMLSAFALSGINFEKIIKKKSYLGNQSSCFAAKFSNGIFGNKFYFRIFLKENK